MQGWTSKVAGVITLIALIAMVWLVNNHDGSATREMHAPVYSDKLVEAKLGPTTFAFPMNLYDSQVGPDFQGSVGLTLRWPSLEPFPPGAEHDPAFSDAYMNEAIGIRPHYVDKVPIKSLPMAYVDGSLSDADDPVYRLSERKKGGEVFGLTPYYVDLDKATSYFRARGYTSNREHIQRVSDDWYFAYGDSDQVVTLVRCDNHEIKGARLMGGRIEHTPPGVSRGMCRHSFTIPEYHLAIHVTYLRAYRVKWRDIEDRVRKLFHRGERALPRPAVAPASTKQHMSVTAPAQA